MSGTRRQWILSSDHKPNTPRAGDVVQCAQCKQAWPCDVRILLDRIRVLEQQLRTFQNIAKQGVGE